MKKLIISILAAVLLFDMYGSTCVVAAEYEFSSGVDTSAAFGKSTSSDNPVSPNPETENIRRNKDAAFFPPAYGVFSGDIPTDRTSLYHDNSMPYSGYTGNTANGGYSTNDYGGSASPITGADYEGLLPSTSIYTPKTLNTMPLYYTDGSIGTLSIPKLKLNVTVYEGETLESMQKGVGHFEFTSVWDGNVGISGHNRGAATYFGEIKNLRIGDTIVYSTKYGTRTYEIYRKEKISDTDYSSLSWSDENILTLITCVENQSTQRWCVQAEEIR